MHGVTEMFIESIYIQSDFKELSLCCAAQVKVHHVELPVHHM